MKAIAVALFGCLAVLASGSYMNRNVKYAEKDFLEKQKFIFDMFQHVNQDEVLMQKYKDGRNFNIQNYYDKYDKVELVKEFHEYYDRDVLPIGEIFTIFNKEHVSYSKRLIYTFFFAKDWDTFYKTVLWARFHVNKDAFVYALSIAALHRADMQGIVIPAIYEILPHFFFDTETIQKAQLHKMQGFYGMKKVEDVYDAIIPVNDTAIHGHVNYENLLGYFTEDIGLNAFYYYYNLGYPFWTNGKVGGDLIKDRRGEFYLHVHHQLFARYYMERLSNDLPDVDEFDFYTGNFPGYFPRLNYYNGIHFTDREMDTHLYHSGNFYNIDLATIYSHRIFDAIDYKYAIMPDGKHFELKDVKTMLETLGNMIQGNKDSVNRKVYGSLDYYLRTIINEANDVPGALYHYETSLRDPAFFQMCKFILRYYWHYLDSLKPYTKDELQFNGVKVENVEMDKLVTYFDKFDADITNAVDVEHFNEKDTTDLHKFGRLSNYQGHDFVIKARQNRLNHLPFTFKLTLNSNKAQKATVKIFYGPKYDFNGKTVDITINRKNFVELDHFLIELTEGKNIISRRSNDFSWYVNDRTTYLELYKKLFQATNGNYKFPLDMSEAHCGFPSRLMLPKGKRGGMPMQFFFYVAPYQEPKVKQFTGFDPTISCGIGSGARYLDDTTFNFPLDRVIDLKNWYVDNMFTYNTLIYHKTETEVNAVPS